MRLRAKLFITYLAAVSIPLLLTAQTGTRAEGGPGCGSEEPQASTTSDDTEPTGTEEASALILDKDEDGFVDVAIGSKEDLNSICTNCDQVSWYMTANTSSSASVSALQAAVTDAEVDPQVSATFSECEDDVKCKNKGKRGRIRGAKNLNKLLFARFLGSSAVEVFFPNALSLFGVDDSSFRVFVAPVDVELACEEEGKTLADCELDGIDSAFLRFSKVSKEPSLPDDVLSLSQILCNKPAFDITTGTIQVIDGVEVGLIFKGCSNASDNTLHLVMESPQFNPPVVTSFELFNPDIEFVAFPRGGGGCPEGGPDVFLVLKDGTKCTATESPEGCPDLMDPNAALGPDLSFIPHESGQGVTPVFSQSLKDETKKIVTAIGFSSSTAAFVDSEVEGEFQTALGDNFNSANGAQQLQIVSNFGNFIRAALGMMGALVNDGLFTEPDGQGGSTPYKFSEMLNCLFQGLFSGGDDGGGDSGGGTRT